MRLTESEKFPLDEFKIKSRNSTQWYDYFKLLILKLSNAYSRIANAVNTNEKPRYLAQDAKPTPKQGELLVWKDTDAGVGESTHFLSFNDSGAVVSWDSVEKV